MKPAQNRSIDSPQCVDSAETKADCQDIRSPGRSCQGNRATSVRRGRQFGALALLLCCAVAARAADPAKSRSEPRQSRGRAPASSAQNTVGRIENSGVANKADAGQASDASELNRVLMFAIREPAVQRELRLQPRQTETINQALAEVDPPLWALRDAPAEQAVAKVASLRAAFAARLAAVLKPDQKERLDQIGLQALSLASLAVPRVAEQIELSKDQQARIREIFAETQQAVAAAQAADVKPSANALRATTDKLLASGRRKVFDVLSDDQRQRFIGLLGEPFETAKIRQAAASAPDLKNIDGWLNGPPLSLERLHGKVVALHFWAFGCINCVHNLPWYKGWHEAYAPRGLVVLGIHTPETEAERDANRVKEKVQENGIEYPVAIDVQAQTWKAWSNTMWPSVYLIDKRGYVRYWWYGELNWQGAAGEKLMRSRIEELLAEKD